MLRNRRDLVFLLLLSLGGAVAGGLFAVVVFPRLEPLPPPWVFLPGLVVVLYLVIVCHELGHLAAGLTQNFRFASMIAGPLWIENTSGRLRLRLNRSLALAGGIVSMLPSGDRELRRRMMVLLAGGPGASLLLAAALFAAGLAWPPAPLLLMGSLMSFLIGAATLIPNELGGFGSDGHRLLQLWKGGEPAERLCRMQALYAASHAGLAVADWPAEVVERLEDDPGDRTESSLGLSLVYLWRLERGEVQQAGEALDRMLANRKVYPAITISHLLLEAAWFLAVHRKQGLEARDWLSQAGESKMLDEGQRARAEAAVLALEGDWDAARLRQAEALEHLRSSPAEGSYKLVERMIQDSVPSSATPS